MKALYYFVIILFAVLFQSQVFSQSITINSISKNQFCEGESLTVVFTATGDFDDENVFIAQLSDIDGSFSSFMNIGNIKVSDSLGVVTDSIICKIPKSPVKDNRYRIRLISSNPYFVGSDNGTNLAIEPIPNPKFWSDSANIYNSTMILQGKQITFTNASTDSADYYWDFGEGAVPPTFEGYNPPPVIYSSPGCKRIELKAVTGFGCSGSYFFPVDELDFINVVCVFSCNVSIPKNAKVVNKEVTYHGSYDTIWVCSNGTLNKDGGGDELIFVESGGTVNLNPGGYEKIYLKPGASVNANGRGFVFVQAPGSSLKKPHEWATILECPNLTFNYKDAPEEGLIAMQLGVNDDSPQLFDISPNPAEDFIEISVGAQGSVPEIRIFNVFGETVKNPTQTLPEGEGLRIDVSGLPSGVYFVRVGDKVGKFVKI